LTRLPFGNLEGTIIWQERREDLCIGMATGVWCHVRATKLTVDVVDMVGNTI
jgi:hypothetical protein